MNNFKGQVTIFIIIAIIIVAAGVGIFFLKDSFIDKSIPASIEPVYTTFLSCLEEDTLVGINVLESQGGYIELPDFEPGSAYMPFSSQLNFMGSPVPYWYYVSGNNIQREQIPSKSNMESQLEDYIEEEIRDCIFEEYYEEGFEIDLGEPKAKVDIKDREVSVNLDMNLNINKEEDSVVVENHDIEVRSSLGKLYNSAKKVYEYEQDTLFLEEYGVDILRLYAPVDGVELTCSPLTWNADDVFEELQEAIEANTMALKVEGGDYDLRKEENKYFVIGVDVDEEVRFLNSRDWPSSFEVNPSEGSILISKPVGNQPGLGVLGFCYVPYHFVYNVRYPVLVQVQDGEEIFQFPVAIVIQGNMPREALEGSAITVQDSEICEHKNTLITVKTYDTNLYPIETDISYKCFNEVCSIGRTKSGSLKKEFPQCVNGYVVARAEGYEETKYLQSTMDPGSVSIILDKLYELDLDLNLNGKSYNKDAIVTFISEDGSKTVLYPDQKSVELSEGQYEIQVQVYKDSSLRLQETVKEQCVEVPQSGIGGLFGLTKEKCFDITIPSQIVSNALAGGGKENYYILENELKNSDKIEINAESLPTPKSIEDLQNNYILFEDKGLDIVFK